MFWPCREIGPNGEQCALDAGHDGQHIPRPAAVVSPPPVAGPSVGAPPSTMPPAFGSPPSAPPPAYQAPQPPAYQAPQPPAFPVSGAVTGTPWSGPAPTGRGKGPLVAIGLGLVAVLAVGVVGFAMLGDGAQGDGDATANPSRPAVAVPQVTPGPSPSTAVRPIGLPGATGTPNATATPSATSAPSTTTSPILNTTPPATPAPTPKPLGFGTLSYSAAACFEVDWKDAKGRQISGAEARYAITVKNKTGARTRNIWIGIQTTDQFTTDPLISSASWSKRPKTLGDETTLVIAGPRLDTGSTRLKWRVFYQTPIDVHTRIWIAQGPNPAKGTMTLEEITAASPYVWDVKTNVKVCY